MTQENLIKLLVVCGYRRLPSIPSEQIALEKDSMTIDEFRTFMEYEKKLTSVGDNIPASIRSSDPWERRKQAIALLEENHE